MMKITCPKCGEVVLLNGIGRKRIEVPAQNVLGAIRTCHRRYGSINYSEASRILAEDMGMRLHRDFVRQRLNEMAAAKDLSREEFIAKVLKEKEK